MLKQDAELRDAVMAAYQSITGEVLTSFVLLTGGIDSDGDRVLRCLEPDEQGIETSAGLIRYGSMVVDETLREMFQDTYMEMEDGDDDEG